MTTPGRGRFRARLRDALVESPTDRSEVMIALVAVAWGLVLLNPVARTFDGAAAWGAMRFVAPEEVWGTGAVLTGACSIVAIGRGDRFWRRWCALAHGLAWLFVAAMLFISSPTGTGWTVYGAFSALGLIAFLRLAPLDRLDI